jgi:hypothetical protein
MALRKLMTVEWAFLVRSARHAVLMPPVPRGVARNLGARMRFNVELRMPHGATEQAKAWIAREFPCASAPAQPEGPPESGRLWLDRGCVPPGTEVWVDDAEE